MRKKKYKPRNRFDSFYLLKVLSIVEGHTKHAKEVIRHQHFKMSI